VSAPAAHIEWLRLLLALAATKDWSIHHLDVKSAFFNDELVETVFVRLQASSSRGAKHKVMWLHKTRCNEHERQARRHAGRTWVHTL
jgi:hypothetical protein